MAAKGRSISDFQEREREQVTSRRNRISSFEGWGKEDIVIAQGTSLEQLHCYVRKEKNTKTAAIGDIQVELVKAKVTDPLAKALSLVVGEDASQKFLQGENGQRFKLVTVGMVVIALIFSVLFCMLKPTCNADEECVHPGLPGGVAFDLLEVLICGLVGGKLVAKIGLPPLFGQLLVGFLLRNIIPDQLNGLSSGLNSMLRSVALAIIMLRAGLGLDLELLRKSSVSAMILATGPCIGEATTIAVLGKVIFPAMSWPFAFMLGFCIADVSPAVTTPILLDLNIEKRGTKKGVPTILLAAGSVNSVIAIVFYKIVEEFAWTGEISPENIASIVGIKFFLQVFGVGGGAGWATGKIVRFCWCFTEDKNVRFAIMFLVAMLTLFGFKQVGMSGGGTLAVLMMGTTLHNSLEKDEIVKVEQPVASILGYVWSNIGAVMLFTLLGSSLDASKLTASLVGTGVMLVILGLLGRSITLFFTLFLFPQWGVKEKLYSMVSWCPKATVQAALATAALDHITAQITRGVFVEGSAEVQQYTDNAMVILTTAVLSIIMTAPLFAVLMVQLAPRLLDDDSKAEEAGTSDKDGFTNV
jgi:NhaP-type Na+/H+ or K+/H+ antiporter